MMNCRPEVTGQSPLNDSFNLSSADDDRVMTFDEWCARNSFSRSTGQRIIAAGNGPNFIQLSARRKGVTYAEDRRWKQSRLIESAA